MTAVLPLLPADPPGPGLGRGARVAGVMLWSAFLAAALATMLCFAFIDPQAFAAGETPAWWSSRLHVYAIGFFFFWLMCLVAAFLGWYLTHGSRAER